MQRESSILLRLIFSAAIVCAVLTAAILSGADRTGRRRLGKRGRREWGGYSMKALHTLIVEDDAMIGGLLAETLEGIGHTVCTVESNVADGRSLRFVLAPRLDDRRRRDLAKRAE